LFWIYGKQKFFAERPDRDYSMTQHTQLSWAILNDAIHESEPQRATSIDYIQYLNDDNRIYLQALTLSISEFYAIVEALKESEEPQNCERCCRKPKSHGENDWSDEYDINYF